MHDLLALLEFATSGFWRFVGCFLLLTLPTSVLVTALNALGSLSFVKHYHYESKEEKK